jgi:hypothetical protein
MSRLLANLNIDQEKVQPLPEHMRPKKVERKVVSQAALDKRLKQILKDRFQPYETITTLIRDTIMAFEQHFEGGGTNPKWLNARMDLITGSILAGIVGWSPFSDPIRTIMEKLWRKFTGNVATRYGTENEENANSATEVYYESLNGTVNPVNSDEVQVSAVVREVGLVRSIAFVFAGMSPDGILTREYKNNKTGEVRVQRQLLEYKCPYKRRNLTDHWPAYDLYDKYPVPHVPGTKANKLKQPIPQYYYTQLMWGGLIMGNHALAPMLAKSPKLDKFMAPHLDKAVDSSSDNTMEDVRCGEDLIDTDHPILFIVWAPCTDLRKKISTPEVYYEDPEACSKFIRTKFGAIQLTEVEYNHDFATWMLEEVFDFWLTKYMPRMVLKEMGMLLNGELDVPLNLDSDCED